MYMNMITLRAEGGVLITIWMAYALRYRPLRPRLRRSFVLPSTTCLAMRTCPTPVHSRDTEDGTVERKSSPLDNRARQDPHQVVRFKMLYNEVLDLIKTIKEGERDGTDPEARHTHARARRYGIVCTLSNCPDNHAHRSSKLAGVR